MLRSHLHDVYTKEINKVALSADDDKRVIMKDGIVTLAHGYYGLTSMIDYEKLGTEILSFLWLGERGCG